MNKAYDRVEWDFLEATLVRFGFDRRWINLIMSCVTTVSFSIVLNGNPGNFFYSSRGLRQDAAIDVLPSKYSGHRESWKVPTFWGRSKSQALGYIKDRISGKISGWKEKSLSQAGKTVLIKAVALAVPAFPMTCFRFPKNVCDDINSALGNFWWGSVDGKNKTHWRSWSHLCKSKEEGGLGFRDLHHFNLALLAKQAWRLIENPESTWARVLKARYFPRVGFSEAKKGYQASWGWSSLLEARDFVTKMGCWHVINSSSINLWKDQWLPLGLASLLPLVVGLASLALPTDQCMHE
ncbi:hypothetical protein ACLB2K_030064 [Fragaria x ananassa]